MIDFVKIRLPSKYAPSLLNNELLRDVFATEVNEPTGVVLRDIKIAEWNGFKITIANSNFIEIAGSLHKYFQAGTNFKDFNYTDLQEAINDLRSKLQFKIQDATIHSIEFGVNIETPFDPDEIINGILNYKKQSFNKMGRGGHSSIGVDCYKQQYGLKAYNKGRQNNITEENIFRFEIKVLKMEYLKKIGVVSLTDLFDTNKLSLLGNRLFNSFSEVVVYESSVDKTKLNKSELTLYENGSNPKYWERLKEESPKMFDYNRNRFRSIVKRNATDNLQGHSLTLISKKWNELLNSAGKKTLANLTDPLKLSSTKRFSQINHSYSKLNPPMLENWDEEAEEIGSYFGSSRFPDGIVMLNKWSSITNLTKFIHNHLAIVKANNGNKVYLPYLERLRECKMIMEKLM